MTFAVALILDILIIVMLFYFIFRGFRYGFVKSIAYFAGTVASFVVAYFGSDALSSLFRTGTRGFFVEQVRGKIGDVVNLNPQEALMQVYSSFPTGLQHMLSGYIGDPQTFFGEQNFSGPIDVAAIFTDQVLMPLLTTIAHGIFFLLLFFLCSFVIKRLVRSLGFINHIPLIGAVNALLGGILGVLQAALFCFVLTTIVGLYLTFTGGVGYLVDTAVVNQSTVFEFVYALNPLF